MVPAHEMNGESHLNAAPRLRATLAAALATVMVLAVVPPAQATQPDRGAVADAAADLQAWRGGGSPRDTERSAWATGPDVVPGQLIVTAASGGGSAFQAFAADRYERATQLAPGITAVHVEPGQEAATAAELRARGDVATVEPNRIREFLAVPDDPLYADQWAHQATGIEAAWDVTTGSADVLVAVVDSGIVASHTDLGGILEQVDAGTGEIRPGAVDNDPCQVGHGTWVAGVLGALGDNGRGVAGVSWNVSILDINTADPEVTCGGPSDAGTIAAIAHATRQGADIVNLSLGGPALSCPRALQDVIDAARAAGTAIIAAAGNSGESTPQVPGSCNGVISVGATDADGALAGYSTTNPYVDIAAPGGAGIGTGYATEIATTSWWQGGQRTAEYIAIAGTSFATPYVAGLAALMRAARPELSPDDIESLLQSTAVDLGPEGRDDGFGWGLAQGAAVIAAAQGGAVPAPQPGPDFPVGSTDGGQRPGGDVPVFRVSAGTGTTEAITQAVAVSQTVFADADAPGDQSGGVVARWAVVARADDHADALAGASLTLGVAPLLFSPSSGPLATPTALELARTLAPGSTVYLLGGEAALPATLDAELAALGFTPVRLAGPYREATAVAVADELDAVLQAGGLQPAPAAIVVNREDWPDAIAAGQLGAQLGLPVLLTPAGSLSPDTAAALDARQLAALYVVGGTVRVAEATMASALQQAQLDRAIRLAGEERTGTVVAVSGEVELLLAQTPLGRPANALAVNVRRADGYAHMLSATMPLASFTGVFLPVEGEGGTEVPPTTQAYAAGLGLPLALMGDVDLIADTTGAALQQVVETPPTG